MINKKSNNFKNSDIISPDKWGNILQRFSDALRLNIFIVDLDGHPIITPEQKRHGWDLLVKSPIGSELLSEKSGFLEKFKKHGFYLEYHYQYDLHSFAIPIEITDNSPIAYIVVGPVVLNRRLTKADYEKMADSLKMASSELINSINEVRIMSFIGIKTVLDLLDEVSTYIVQLNVQKQELFDYKLNQKLSSAYLEETAEHIESKLRIDELLTTFLDIALNITKTECGSIMLRDHENTEVLVIRAAKGINRDIVQKSRCLIGEGLAGISAQENSSFVIHGTKTDNKRLKPYLKRPDIKHSVIAPLRARNNVFGVLNLHTKNLHTSLDSESLDTLEMLGKLTFAAIENL